MHGLPASVLKFPNLNVSGYSSLGGVNSDNRQSYNTSEAAVNVTNVFGQHTLRSGVAWRVYQLNAYDLGRSSGSFTFHSTSTRASSTSASSPIGQGMASFLYGIPSSRNFPINANYAEPTRYWAFYSPDDWQATTN